MKGSVTTGCGVVVFGCYPLQCAFAAKEPGRMASHVGTEPYPLRERLCTLGLMLWGEFKY